ncbi:ATP-binding protein [Dyella sp. Tek66A03]|uniref:ATP-binding protein n=1 Tax=Dyella sp. Tek66A03 TaxID=3458298 RepID=UPI00403EE81B
MFKGWKLRTSLRHMLPRSLFGRSFLLFLIMSTVAHVATLATYTMLLWPQAVELGKLTAWQINALDSALSEIPASRRDEYMARMRGVDSLAIASAPPLGRRMAERGNVLSQAFFDSLVENLPPGLEIRRVERAGDQVQYWVSQNIGGRQAWVLLPISDLVRYGWVVTMVLQSLGVVLLIMFSALLIQWRINRPLLEIAGAARKIGAGDHSQRLPIYPVVELAAVAQQFNAMSDSLQDMEATRAVMLAGISHDIRTPLTQLRLALAIGARSDELHVSRYIDQIDAIVDQFLDFGRSGGDEELIVGNLNTLILQLAGEFEERGHVFELCLGVIPDQRFRPVAMLRVMSNLMENAVKYAGCGLAVRTAMAHGQVELAVLDAGPGLPSGDEARVRHPFVRGQASSAVKGLGLGLAIVERLTRLHGGNLRLNSRHGKGLEAVVTLPLATSTRVA